MGVYLLQAAMSQRSSWKVMTTLTVITRTISFVFLRAKYDTFTTNCELHCAAMKALWHYSYMLYDQR